MLAALFAKKSKPVVRKQITLAELKLGDKVRITNGSWVAVVDVYAAVAFPGQLSVTTTEGLYCVGEPFETVYVTV